MGEIEDRKIEIGELCEEISSGLEMMKQAKGLSSRTRAEKIEFLKNRIGRAKLALKSMKVELREMPKLQQRPHLEKATQLEEKIKQLEADIDWAEKADPNDELKNQAMATDHKAVLNEAAQIQEGDINKLKDIKRVIQNTTQVGTDTLVEMQTQKEQLARIDDGVDQVKSNIQLANKHLRVFVRRMATDKIIMGFLLLIFLGVIFIIIYSTVINPKAKTNVPENWRNS